MSIALDASASAAELHTRCSLYGAPPPPEPSSSSSIGKNSDPSDSEGDVQSTVKGPLENVDSLEDALPMRHGISKFYSGRSKSFTSLADVGSSSSTKDLAKPENAYSRKRKNLVAFSTMYDTRNNKLRSVDGCPSKRPANFSWHTPGSSIITTSGGNSARAEEHGSIQLLPPRCPHGVSVAVADAMASPLGFSPPRKPFSSMRSFSLADLRGIISSNTSHHPSDKKNIN